MLKSLDAEVLGSCGIGLYSFFIHSDNKSWLVFQQIGLPNTVDYPDKTASAWTNAASLILIIFSDYLNYQITTQMTLI